MVAPVLLAFAAGAVLAIGLAAGLRRAPAQAWFPKRLTQALQPPPAHSWDIALSRDGRRLAYVANAGGWEQIHVREIDQLESKTVPGTEGGFSAFFSPDGASMGFTTSRDRKLKVVSLRGGRVRALADAPGLRGASWGLDGQIVYCPAPDAGLFLIASTGGTPRPLTTPDVTKGEVGHCWPRILPGGRAALFTVMPKSGQEEDREIAVVSLETGERRTLLKGGTYPLFSPPRHLLYGSEGQLFAAPFDLDRLELAGPAVPVLEQIRVMAGGGGVAAVDVSEAGLLVYFTALPLREPQLVWVDRRGRVGPLTRAGRAYGFPALSADGRRIAAVVDGDVWVGDLAGERWERITFDGRSTHPVWSNDGQLAFSSQKEEAGNLFWSRGPFSPPMRLTRNVNHHVPTSFSPDGKRLAFSERNPLSWDVGIVALEGEQTPHFLLGDPDRYDLAARFSPDGRWLAYVSLSATTRGSEVRLRPYPGSGDSILVAEEGADSPLWSRDGTELYFRKGKAVLAAPVRAGGRPGMGASTVLFEGTFVADPYGGGNYDVSKDGRFVMVQAPERPPPKVVVVPDWAEELRARVGK